MQELTTTSPLSSPLLSSSRTTFLWLYFLLLVIFLIFLSILSDLLMQDWTSIPVLSSFSSVSSIGVCISSFLWPSAPLYSIRSHYERVNHYLFFFLHFFCSLLVLFQDVETRVFSPTASFVGPGPTAIKRRVDLTNGSRPKSPATPKRQRTSSRTSNWW